MACRYWTRRGGFGKVGPGRRTRMANGGAQPRGVHLVGSAPVASAEDLFRLAGPILGRHLRRLPDGETGERLNWILWQYPVLANHPSLEVVAPDPFARPSLPRVRLRAGAVGADVRFEGLGYADAALASFETFSRLQRDGVIPADCRFQVSLPPPATVT